MCSAKILLLISMTIIANPAFAQDRSKVDAVGSSISGLGCTEKGVENNCIVLRDRDSKELFNLHFPGKGPGLGQTITFTGTAGSVGFCQQGRSVTVTHFTVVRSPCPFVIVYKADGTLQCGEGKEIPLEQMEKELVQGGIAVLSKRKDADGLMHMAVCGSPTGAVNAYEISRTDLAAATKLGYRQLQSHVDAGGKKSSVTSKK